MRFRRLKFHKDVLYAGMGVLAGMCIAGTLGSGVAFMIVAICGVVIITAYGSQKAARNRIES